MTHDVKGVARVDLGERLFELRERKGWSQAELAQISNVSHTTITHIETGKNQHPRTPTLRRLARAFGIGVEELAGDLISPKVPALRLEEMLDADASSRSAALKVSTLEERAGFVAEIDAAVEEADRIMGDDAAPAAERVELGRKMRKLATLRALATFGPDVVPVRKRERV